MKKNEVKMNNKGFSLVELIVVIAIMAVLVGVLAPMFIRYVEKAREGTDINNLDSCISSVESYCADKEDLANVEIVLQLGQPVKVNNPSSTITQASVGGDLVNSAIISAAGDNLPLKGSKWDTGKTPKCVYTPADGKKIYTADSDFYQANGTTDTEIKPK